MQPTPVVVETGFALAKAITTEVRKAIDRSPPPQFVVLSSVGSEKASGLGNIIQTLLHVRSTHARELIGQGRFAP